MTAKAFDFAAWTREQFPGALILALRREADFDPCLDALDAFKRSGDRAALYRSLIALGLPADMIRRVADGETPSVSTCR